jgi:hypothetical protein
MVLIGGCSCNCSRYGRRYVFESKCPMRQCTGNEGRKPPLPLGPGPRGPTTYPRRRPLLYPSCSPLRPPTAHCRLARLGRQPLLASSPTAYRLPPNQPWRIPPRGTSSRTTRRKMTTWRTASKALEARTRKEEERGARGSGWEIPWVGSASVGCATSAASRRT